MESPSIRLATSVAIALARRLSKAAALPPSMYRLPTKILQLQRPDRPEKFVREESQIEPARNFRLPMKGARSPSVGVSSPQNFENCLE